MRLQQYAENFLHPSASTYRANGCALSKLDLDLLGKLQCRQIAAASIISLDISSRIDGLPSFRVPENIPDFQPVLRLLVMRVYDLPTAGSSRLRPPRLMRVPRRGRSLERSATSLPLPVDHELDHFLFADNPEAERRRAIFLYRVVEYSVYRESRLAGREGDRAVSHDVSGRADGLFEGSKDLCFAGC